MVRILANGDIVQDDDPRVRKNTSNVENRYRGSGSSSQFYQQNEQQQHAGEAYQQGMQQGPTIFDTWNQKLLELGIPRWNIGNHVVEPIMTVMVLLVLLVFGLPGVLFLGLLYFVVKLSQRTSTQGQQPRSNGPPRPTRGLGGGRRLGR